MLLQNLVQLLQYKAPIPHRFPFSRCLPQWQMGQQFLRCCKIGALQYVPVKLAMAGASSIVQVIHSLTAVNYLTGGSWLRHGPRPTTQCVLQSGQRAGGLLLDGAMRQVGQRHIPDDCESTARARVGAWWAWAWARG